MLHSAAQHLSDTRQGDIASGDLALKNARKLDATDTRVVFQIPQTVTLEDPVAQVSGTFTGAVGVAHIGSIPATIRPEHRFICKSILRMGDKFMVTYPDYGRMEYEYSTKDTSKLLDVDEVLEWVRQRLLRFGGTVGNQMAEVILPEPPPKPERGPRGGVVRTRDRLKKLWCGHLASRKGHRGPYPRRCEDCKKVLHENIRAMRRRGL